MATTGKARAVNNLSPVQGAVHTRKDVAAQFVPKKARSTRRQHSIVSAMADFDSDSPTENFGPSSESDVNWRQAALVTTGVGAAVTGTALLALGGDGGGFGWIVALLGQMREMMKKGVMLLILMDYKLVVMCPSVGLIQPSGIAFPKWNL